MIRLSNKIYCDKLFEKIVIPNAVLTNQYKDYPYLIIENFISDNLCKEIVTNAKQEKDIEKAKIKKYSKKGIIFENLNEKYRKTYIHKIKQKDKILYEKQFLQYRPMIEEYFKVVLTLSTKIQLLEYTKGFFYKKHADDSSQIVDKHNNTIGFKNIAKMRKLTSVLFATTWDDHITNDYTFSGGELVFNYLYDENNNQIKVKPKAGNMIIFPSNPYFSHEVLPVVSGNRFTLVQWHDAIV